MLARTRVDVDALNQRARAAALAAGEVAGPVTLAGGRQWQAGDVLRARRNDRRLVIGDGHVRNGDRYRVLGPGPQDGLIVQDLTGRGRTVLPARYLTEHAEYGWASTIDAAQGGTADVGIVLVRPGLDREHLYVAMTRGRHGNHAYITPDSPTADDHHGPRQPPLHEGGAQPAGAGCAGARDGAPEQRRAGRRAHRARARARPGRARLPGRSRVRLSEPPHPERPPRSAGAGEPRQLTPEHARAVQQLDERRAERDQLRTQRDALHSCRAADSRGARAAAALGAPSAPHAHRRPGQRPGAAAAGPAHPGPAGRRDRAAHPPGRPPHPPAHGP